MYESELRRCVKVEVAVLGYPSLIVHMAFVDVETGRWSWALTD